MDDIITLLLCTVLIMISYYDFKYRAIPVYLILIAVIVSILFAVTRNGLPDVLKYSSVNTGIIVFQLSLTFAYLSAKKGRFINLFQSFLGLGDLCFFIVLIFCFSPINFIVFLIISGFVTIVCHIRANSQTLIPLAGCQALVLCILLLVTLITETIQPYNDLLIAEALFK
jgi:hypothetical protein